MEKVLVDDGYKILSVTRYEQSENDIASSKSLAFPKDFERAAIIQARRNKDIYNFAVIRKKASRSGYTQEKFVDQQFIGHAKP